MPRSHSEVDAVDFKVEVSMNPRSHILQSIGVAMVLAIGMASAARAEDLSQPVLLVASPSLDGTPFEQAVVLAAPLPNGGHIGFVVNMPTTVNLQTLFPNDAGARTVTEPVYIGGPQFLRALFVIAPKAPEGSSAVPLMPGLVVLVDAATIDRVIATTPNDVRYFLGLTLWGADELEGEIDQNAWEVRPADADTVLRAKAPGLWNFLRGPWVNLDMGVQLRPVG
jgi:putative transcriptional regulator